VQLRYHSSILLFCDTRFGGGEFQNGFLDYSNVPIELVQFNTEAVVPFFVSNKGYGILWDNYAWSHLNDAQAVEITFRPVRFFLFHCPHNIGELSNNAPT